MALLQDIHYSSFLKNDYSAFIFCLGQKNNNVEYYNTDSYKTIKKLYLNYFYIYNKNHKELNFEEPTNKFQILDFLFKLFTNTLEEDDDENKAILIVNKDNESEKINSKEKTILEKNKENQSFQNMNNDKIQENEKEDNSNIVIEKIIENMEKEGKNSNESKNQNLLKIINNETKIHNKNKDSLNVAVNTVKNKEKKTKLKILQTQQTMEKYKKIESIKMTLTLI